MGDYPNIIWIVLDTLREDYSDPIWSVLKKYGFVKYENVIAPAPWTIPSHVSMFTGEYPSEHDIHETIHVKVPQFKVPKYITKKFVFALGERHGYTVKFYSANPFVSPATGLYYPSFYDIFKGKYKTILLSEDEQRVLTEVLRGITGKRRKVMTLFKSHNYLLLLKASLEYMLPKSMKKRKEWPLDKGISSFKRQILKDLKSKNESHGIVFVNLMEIHEPYAEWESNTARVYQSHLKSGLLDTNILYAWKKGYNSCVRYLSKALDDIIKVISKFENWSNTMIVITSDHGQLLGEHGHIGHGQWLYDELIKVPLFVKYPHNYYEDIENYKNSEIRSHQYFSLTKLSEFIKEVIEGNIITIDELYSPIAYSEAHGIHLDIGPPKTEKERRNIEKLEKHRIAVYHGPYKGIYNVTDGILECVKSYDNSKITENIKEVLVRDAKRFIRKAKLKRAVRNVKL